MVERTANITGKVRLKQKSGKQKQAEPKNRNIHAQEERLTLTLTLTQTEPKNQTIHAQKEKLGDSTLVNNDNASPPMRAKVSPFKEQIISPLLHLEILMSTHRECHREPGSKRHSNEVSKAHRHGREGAAEVSRGFRTLIISYCVILYLLSYNT